ncbi:MAG TPA: MFS transporter, partial [Agromyces sp.]|nr:MFS transporter [Agromyces sp.]
MIGIRSFWNALPTEGRWLLSTVAIQTLGRGLTLPFTIIYLHEVRGFDLGLSGALMSLIAVTG